MELVPSNAFEQRAYCRLLSIIGGTDRLSKVVKDLRFMDCVSGPTAWNALVDAENGDVGSDNNGHANETNNTHAAASEENEEGLVLSQDAILDKKYWTSLCNTLPRLRNLHTLRVHVNENDDTKLSLGWIFSSCIPSNASLLPPFQLHTLAIHFEADDDVLRFLASQPRIKSLQLDFWAPQSEVLPPQALPKLESLTAGTDVIAHILPGRRTVRAVECDYWLDGTLQEGGDTFPSVQALKLRDVRLDPAHFKVLAAAFPNIRFLCYCSEPTPVRIIVTRTTNHLLTYMSGYYRAAWHVRSFGAPTNLPRPSTQFPFVPRIPTENYLQHQYPLLLPPDIPVGPLRLFIDI